MAFQFAKEHPAQGGNGNMAGIFSNSHPPCQTASAFPFVFAFPFAP